MEEMESIYGIHVEIYGIHVESMWKYVESMVRLCGIHKKMYGIHGTEAFHGEVEWNPHGMWGHSKVLSWF